MLYNIGLESFDAISPIIMGMIFIPPVLSNHSFQPMDSITKKHHLLYDFANHFVLPSETILESYRRQAPFTSESHVLMSISNKEILKAINDPNNNNTSSFYYKILKKIFTYQFVHLSYNHLFNNVLNLLTHSNIIYKKLCYNSNENIYYNSILYFIFFGGGFISLLPIFPLSSTTKLLQTSEILKSTSINKQLHSIGVELPDLDIGLPIQVPDIDLDIHVNLYNTIEVAEAVTDSISTFTYTILRYIPNKIVDYLNLHRLIHDFNTTLCLIPSYLSFQMNGRRCGASSGVYALAGASVPIKINDLYSKFYSYYIQYKYRGGDSINIIEFINTTLLPSISLVGLCTDIASQIYLLCAKKEDINESISKFLSSSIYCNNPWSISSCLPIVDVTMNTAILNTMSYHLQSLLFGGIVSMCILSNRKSSSTSSSSNSSYARSFHDGNNGHGRTLGD